MNVRFDTETAEKIEALRLLLFQSPLPATFILKDAVKRFLEDVEKKRGPIDLSVLTDESKRGSWGVMAGGDAAIASPAEPKKTARGGPPHR